MPTRFLLSTLLALSGVFVFPSIGYAITYIDTLSLNNSSDIYWPLSNDGDGVEEAGENESYIWSFVATTTIEVDTVTLNKIVAGEGTPIEGYIWVWNNSTTTFLNTSEQGFISIMPISYNAVAQTITGTTSEPFYLASGNNYVFEFQPYRVFDPDVSYYWGGTGANSNYDSYYNGQNWSYNNTYPEYRSYTGAPNYGGIKLENNGYAPSSVAPIVITAPCESDSYELPCSYGLASTTEFITITGVSTLNITPLVEFYGVGARWVSANGNLFDSVYYPLDYTESPADFNVELYRPWASEVSSISFIQVCQLFSDTWEMSGYAWTDYEETDCVTVYVGSDISTASTTELAAELGFYDVGPEDTPIENTTDFTTELFNKWLEKIKTYGVFAFWIPFMITSQSVLTDYMTNGTSSTSTITTFDIPLNMSAFGLPTTTAHLPVSGMLSKAEELSPDFFEAIEWILWGLFWLFILSRILHGAWNVLPERNSRDDNRHRFNQGRFASDLGKTLQSNNVWRK